MDNNSKSVNDALNALADEQRVTSIRILSNDSQQNAAKLRASFGLPHSFIVPQFRNGRMTMNGASVRNRDDVRKDRVTHYTRNPGIRGECCGFTFDEIYTTHRKAT